MLPARAAEFVNTSVLFNAAAVWTPRLLLAMFLALLLGLSWFKAFDHDEFESLKSSWKILHGQRVYLDFFQHHHPFWYYSLVPISMIFGDALATLFAARIFTYLLALGILWQTYRIAALVYSKEIAMTAMLLLGFNTIFMNKVIEARPDSAQVLFGLAAVYFFFAWLKQNRMRDLIAAGVTVSVAFLFLQKAVLLFLGIALILCLRLLQGHSSLRQILVYFISFATPWLLYLGFLITQGEGAMGAYILQNFSLNLLNPSVPGSVDMVVYSPGHQTSRLLTNLIEFSTITLLFSGLSLLAPHSRQQKYFIFLAFFLFMLAISYRAQFQQYYLQSLPLVSVVAAYGVHQSFNSRRAPIAVCLLIAAIGPTLTAVKDIKWSYQDEQTALISHVLSNTSAGDYVYDGNINFNLFRPDLHFFWFGVAPGSQIDRYLAFRELDYDIYELIEEREPAYISDFAIPDMADSRISDHYAPVESFPSLYRRTSP
jgi:4-amino-4-deoxy-L-arabinose transferase-like glycosyltransferase